MTVEVADTVTGTLFEKLQAAYRRGVDFACWHFNTSEEKYMELWEFVPKAAYDYADKETGDPQVDDGKDALIRELVAALSVSATVSAKLMAGATLTPDEWRAADAALIKAKAAGYEP